MHNIFARESRREDTLCETAIGVRVLSRTFKERG